MKRAALLAIIHTASTLSLTAAGVRLPDPSTGEIGGRVAVLIAPGDVSTRGELVPRDADHCVVKIMPEGAQAHAASFPCSEWFQPLVPGRYIHWMEQRWSISHQTVLGYAGEPFTGRGSMLVKRMYPAGAVRLDPKSNVARDATFRLISTNPRGKFRLFDRRIASVDAHEPVLVPVGGVIAGIFDAKGNAIALTPIVTVNEGQTVVVMPAPPKAKEVLAVVDRHADDPIPRCQATLIDRGGRLQSPSIDVQAEGRLVFLWNDVSGDAASLRVACGSAPAFQRDVRFAQHGITTVRGSMPAKERTK